jgi:hypothetical protein
LSSRLGVPSRSESRLLSSRLGVPSRIIQVDRSRPSEDATTPRWPRADITPSGPTEWEWSEQARRLAGITARRLFGRHTDAVRVRLSALLRRVKTMTSGEVRPRADG